MKFMTNDYIMTSKRLMLKFNRLNITDCSVLLNIFYTSDAHGSPDVSFMHLCVTCNVHTMHELSVL
jgi:hypothetical protein